MPKNTEVGLVLYIYYIGLNFTSKLVKIRVNISPLPFLEGHHQAT